MRMYDLIKEKRDGGVLSDEEIRWMIDGYVKGEIPDYQMSAMLMAIYFQGMTDHETAVMTDAAAHSGDMVDLSSIPGVKVDKHSTGGVGDKTTLIVGPIAAACGVKIAKMSGRGLGHTGGTVDKLESIPGMQVALDREAFFRIVKEIGLCVIGQSGNLTPADKKMYALRDVTGTVESIPLIAMSIMSKKLAAGSDCILLDVKCGSGAFMKTKEQAVTLAEKMVAIGEHAGRKVGALITNLDIPLGHKIGNSLEVEEAVETLRGEGPADLTEICLELAAHMLYLAGKGSLEECRRMSKEAVESGAALRKLEAMVEAQGGDVRVIRDPALFAQAPVIEEIKAPASGYITHMDTEAIGVAAALLGAGRETKDDTIDYSAGIVLQKKTGEYVEQGQTIALFHTSERRRLKDAEERFLHALTIEKENREQQPLILGQVVR